MARLLRLRPMLDKGGNTRSPTYKLMSAGLWPRPVKIGPRAVAWPEHEVDAVIAARIAGKSDDEVRALVAKLHAARGEGAAS